MISHTFIHRDFRNSDYRFPYRDCSHGCRTSNVSSPSVAANCPARLSSYCCLRSSSGKHLEKCPLNSLGPVPRFLFDSSTQPGNGRALFCAQPHPLIAHRRIPRCAFSASFPLLPSVPASACAHVQRPSAHLSFLLFVTTRSASNVEGRGGDAVRLAERARRPRAERREGDSWSFRYPDRDEWRRDQVWICGDSDCIRVQIRPHFARRSRFTRRADYDWLR